MAAVKWSNKGFYNGRNGLGYAFALDMRGFDRMIAAVSKEHRVTALKKAMYSSGGVVLNKIRSNYRSLKPRSDLWNAIVPFMYPSGEGVGVRRYYIKSGDGKHYDQKSPKYRAYILNFIERGASARKTKGKGRRYRGAKYAGLNRGSVPAAHFFQRGWNSSRERAFKEMERIILKEIAALARRGSE